MQNQLFICNTNKVGQEWRVRLTDAFMEIPMRYALFLPLLALAACGSNEKSFTVNDGEGSEQTVTVKEDDETTTIRSEDGEAVIQTGDVEAEFPVYAPQYPGSKVTASANFSNKEGESGGAIVQETADMPDKVMAFYKDKLTSGGMKIGMETKTGEGGMFIVENPESNGEQTTITFTGGK